MSKTSRENVRDMNTPLNPTFYKENWDLRGYTLFLFPLQDIGFWYSLEAPQ